ncbi:hypothetical protein SAMN06265795_10337 [Noviherbaspirillum humi]|uniref:UPF0178 protein SAMN06265795_10337 n=2 Tax=Noviherbaspirillum humi TaxID=1688639 RepID=A0A239EX31_9BURK|nr:hypothetical protein SAMN06265795_10337 [Noviherbaspirillum humi]
MVKRVKTGSATAYVGQQLSNRCGQAATMGHSTDFKRLAMHIWVDADACPAVIKDILFRVAERLQLDVTLVANRLMRVPGSRFIRALQVPAGADAADAEIVARVASGDIVVTGDIPLAAQVLEKGGLPLNPRGEWYTSDTIAQQLTMRAFMDELRGSGVDTGGPAAFSQADRQRFANALDRELARRNNRAEPR